jgi:hypothetical protein
VKPTALLITMGRYRGVAKRLRDVKAAHDLPGVDLCVKSAGDFDEIPTLMTSAVDLVALDGHGCKNGYYGHQCERQFCPEYLRGEDGAGIMAPIVVLGFCWAGKIRSSAPWKALSAEARQLSSEELMRLNSTMPSESTCPYCGY